MPHEHPILRAWRRKIALAAVTAFGLIAIVGSGGGVGVEGGECSFFTNVCNPGIGNINIFPPAPPAASISPPKLAVQAGRSATFTAHTSGMNQPRYQWLRSADRGATYVDVAGATTAVLTLASAQFADEQAMFRVDVRDGTDSTVRVQSNAVLLLVSSLPAVVVQDGEFQAADWNTSAFVSPSPDGPTHAENRSPTGGLPGAFRRMVHTMTAGPSSLRVFNVNASAVYDPAAQGAIHALDYHEDCTILSASAPSFDVRSYPTLEQAGRRYVSTQGRGCLPQWVGNFGEIPTLQVYDFVQIDGPACASGQACPDFSATGAPLHFGFERRVRLANGVGAGSIEHGIDNWKFSVWRP